jgi:hypothetical protein
MPSGHRREVRAVPFLVLAGYAVLSIFQAIMICGGLVAWTGIPLAVAVLTAALLGLMPGTGTILAILAAASAWSWPWLGSTTLFCSLLALWAHLTLSYGMPSLSVSEED